MARELRLVVKADERGDVRRAHATEEQLLRTRDPEVCEVGVLDARSVLAEFLPRIDKRMRAGMSRSSP